ncbi:NADPH-dependent FMN reductase [Sphingomicrobium nitratireducens]|uniref:NADPH-dependent FMN reductase n=1 Tax=Sphingomicrobium nitratireducens TaxID=2964666 RepID=UPI00223FB803|nr:NADPH-dependent FMN reductase [Sphingomicrobium nitratireducens]
MAKPKVAFICGSIREKSFNRRLGKAVAAMTADRFEIVDVPIGELPLYNQDTDGDDRPPEWEAYRDMVRECDAVLFASPEYNRSMTGALKNAIDVGSRPKGKGVLIGKPCAVFSATPGSTGAENGNLALLPCIKTLDMPDMGQPEAYWGGVNDDKVALDGTIADAGLEKVVRQFANAFADYVEKHCG